MKNKNGWILLHRSIEDWDLYFADPFSRTQAWIDLILIARYEEKPSCLYIRGNKIIINRGQLAWSAVKLGKRWKWGRKKTENFLKDLENAHQIIREKTAAVTIITIVKYEHFQSTGTSDEHQTHIRRTSDEHQRYNIIKKEKKEKKEINNTMRTEFAEYVDFYEKESGRKVKALEIRKKKFESRRKNFSLEEIKEATMTILSDTFLQGDNDRGKAFGDIDFILRNDQQIEKNLKINQKTCTSQKTENVTPRSASLINL